MGILIDSSVLIDVSKGKLSLTQNDALFINPIIYAEVAYGYLRSGKSFTALDGILMFYDIEVLPINIGVGREYTKLKLHLSSSGQIIDDKDMLIAASCLESNLALYTFNMKHFKRVPKLKLHTQ